MTATKSYPRFERGERLDIPDATQMAEVGHRDALAQLIETILVGSDGSPRVVSGFTTTLASSVITVQAGVALTGFRDRGILYRGMVVAGGPASRNFNVSTLPDGSYGVYARLAFRPSTVRTRRFWNSTGSPAAEYGKLLPTRVLEDWDVTPERASPGSEWVLLATFTMTGGSASALADTRKLVFDVAASGAYLDADWGGGNDRVVATRDINGPKGLLKWITAVNRQLQDVIDGSGLLGGVPRWFNDPKLGTNSGSGPRSLTQLNNEKLGRNGVQGMQGDLTGDTDSTRSLGSLAVRWLNAFLRALRVDGDADIGGQVSPGSRLNLSGVPNLKPSVLWTRTNGGEKRTLITHDPHGSGDPNQSEYLSATNAFGVSSGAVGREWVVNCDWDDVAGHWARLNPGQDCLMFRVDQSAVSIFVHHSGGAATWADTVSSTTWDLVFDAGGFEVTAPFLVSDQIVVVDATVTGVLTAAITPASSGGSPAINQLYADNIPKVWGRVVFNGAGGFTVTELFGCTVAIVGTDLVVTFNHAFASANAYACAASGNNRQFVPAPVNTSASVCTILLASLTTPGGTVDASVSTGYSVTFHVQGRQ